MIQTRTRKILNDLWERKIRTLLASVSIFIGVFGVVALSSAGEILVNQLEKDLQQDKLAMLRSSVIVNNTSEVDNDAVLETLQAQEGVTAVEGRAIYPLFWSLESGDEFEEGIVVSHSEPFADSELEPTRLVDGRYPEMTGAEDSIEIAIERRMADKYDLEVGDSLTLRQLSSAGSGDIDTINAEIVGITFQAYGYTGIEGQVSAEELVFAAYEDAAVIAGFRGFRSFYVRFEDYATAEAQQSEFLAAFKDTPYAPTYTQVENPAQNPTIESTRTTNNLLVILALAALVVSGFLIVNLISAIVSEQRRQIGLLKAIGATTGDNVYIYLGTAFAYGLLGTMPGVLLGLPAGYFIAQALAAQSQTIIDTFSVSVVGLALGISVGLAVPILAAIYPVFNGIRVKILDAMTNRGIDSNFGKNRLERLIGNLPIPLGLRQAVRNSFQKRYRLVLTGITLMLASAAFMGIFAVFSSLTGIVEAAFEANGNEVSVSPNQGQEFETVAALLRENVESVESVDPASTLAIEVEGYDPGPVQAGPPGLFAVGFNTENPDILNLDYISGRGWQDDPEREGVVLSASIANAIGKDVGDEVALTGGGNTETFTIIGVANFPADSVWMNWERLARFGGIVDAEGNPFPNQIDVSLEGEDLSPTEVDESIEEMNEVLLANGISSRFQNQVELAELITTIVTFFGLILSLAAFLIALVGAIGLLTTLSLSVFERQKEIGVMRSVGAGSGVIVQQFLFEGLIVGLISWAIAAPLSYLLSQGLIGALPFGGTYELSYPVMALIVGLVGMVFIVSLASIVPSISAARKTVSEILRYQ